MKKQGLLMLAALMGMGSAVFAQDVIINEWSQGPSGSSKEWVELLVVNGPVNMSGWTLGDDSPGDLTFSSDTLWQAVPTGSIIVIYNSADRDTLIPADDTDLSDHLAVIASNNATYFSVGSWPSMSNSTTSDNPILQNGSAANVHDWDQANDASFTAIRPGSNSATSYSGDSAAGISTAGNWTKPAASSATPGAGNGGLNSAWIATLQGGAVDDPDISVSATTLYFPRILSAATNNQDIVVENVGTSNALNVTGSALTGTNASAFGIITEPTVGAGLTGNFTVQFAPDAGNGVYTATLTINSNDTSGDAPAVELYAVAADMTPYAGLYITEVASQPTEDEFVEVTNTTGSAIDVSGVVLSDDDNNNSEGAVKFPAATTLAAGETVVIAVNNSATEPSWLDSLPAGVRVFAEPARDTTTWAAANGNTIASMDEFAVVSGGCSGEIAISSADGVALYHPLLAFAAGRGAQFADLCIDGMNYDNTDSGPSNPINTAGLVEPQATKVGADQPAAGNSFQRNFPAADNIDSGAAFAEATLTVGYFAATSVSDWTLLND